MRSKRIGLAVSSAFAVLAAMGCGARTELYVAAKKCTGTCSAIVLFGGYAGGAVLGDTWTWDGSTWSPSSSSPAPTARQDPTMASDVTSGVVLYGGQGSPGPVFPDTWRWQTSGWSQPAASSPPGRVWTSMAARGVGVVLFGGEGASSFQPLADTWTWDGSGWSEAHPAASPPPRSMHAMASTEPFGGNVMMFGGVTNGQKTLDDTWIWDGATWARPITVPAPPARQQAAMAPLAGKVVLFGGYAYDPSSGNLWMNDTWTWDGTSWTLEHPALSPSARSRHVMATLGSVVVLFGGVDPSGTALGDTWTWDGAAWTELHPPSSPPPREGAAMATAR